MLLNQFNKANNKEQLVLLASSIHMALQAW